MCIDIHYIDIQLDIIYGNIIYPILHQLSVNITLYKMYAKYITVQISWFQKIFRVGGLASKCCMSLDKG